MRRNSSDDYIVVGRIAGLYGVRGWVKVYSHTQPRENILNYATWYLERGGSWQPFTLEAGRTQGKGVVAKLEGCSDRDAAAELMTSTVAIHREQLPGAAAGEYYWADLQGLRVRNLDGVELGEVSHLLETGANDVLVVKQGSEERLIPFVQGQFVTDIDLEQGEMTVDWDPDF
ncbi:MAG: ribosome maturation factor RimM [Gammaproteobacteria bacterium]|nr:ribosome maturation factor RimM [Gammaproteobacteria bacterium]MCW8841213.1 ribosome maturation factor RimM [Gammaproteobacteria bacterium]MCW8927362.1 ribosome maturation factor RimM [Gammaproteobacteria bacterium]MCW8959476.1 ribosome maturation factor RimM [Gammaproteobacteria bacterium]MCW8971810.1 ribosome maturation factor RimM [Gammaproteobacteria bacterium]